MFITVDCLCLLLSASINIAFMFALFKVQLKSVGRTILYLLFSPRRHKVSMTMAIVLRHLKWNYDSIIN